MKIAAIPTKYKGVQFRSRLEARWAAFFDLHELRWEYEPFDLQGYIPDFLISEGEDDDGGYSVQVLVEVKPATDYCDLLPAARKLQASGWPEGEFGRSKEAMIVGANPRIGIMRHVEREDRIVQVDLGGGPRLGARLAGDCVWYQYDDHLAALLFRLNWEPLWVEAGNLVQYKGPGAKR